MKYYFICYQEQFGLKVETGNVVTVSHPFTYSQKAKQVLISWQEITEEEYNLFKSIHKK